MLLILEAKLGRYLLVNAVQNNCIDCPVFLFSWLLQLSRDVESKEVVLDIYLMNGNKVQVNVLTADQTDDVLEVKFMHFI